MRTVEHTARFELPRPVAEVFPLFTPEGEKRWAPGWDYESVVGTEEPSEDDVFLTKSHDHATTQATWLVKRFDPQGHVAAFTAQAYER